MSHHPNAATTDEVKRALEAAIPDSVVQVEGGGGHYRIAVTSPVFQGKGMLESHRLVLGAIAHLMKGDAAPVHAVDQIVTKAS